MSSYKEFKDDASGFIVGAGIVVILALTFQVFLLLGVLLLYPLLLGISQASKGRKLDYIEKDVLKIHTIGILTLCAMGYMFYYFIENM
jgi:hypothetical protein